MNAANRSIKIIKREHRNVFEDEDKPEVPFKRENEIRREILNTIALWVEYHREAKKEFRRQNNFLK